MSALEAIALALAASGITSLFLLAMRLGAILVQLRRIADDTESARRAHRYETMLLMTKDDE